MLAVVDDPGHMTALPQWTEPAEKRGLDPLGIQNSGVVLYQALLPGISNVTLRIRYYGFYCWLSDAYAHHEGSTNLEDWRRWVRRGEALYALVSSAAGDEVSMLPTLGEPAQRSSRSPAAYSAMKSL
jgi:hypothetical protein